MSEIKTMPLPTPVEKKIKLSNILALTDFSKDSERALDYALALARSYEARIYLTHVITPDPFAYAEPGYAQINYEKVKQAAEQSIADILISGKLRGVAHEVLLEEGNLWPMVRQLIEKHEIDLVVAGTHGRGQVKKVLLGSVTEEIIRKANCPVKTIGRGVVANAPQEVGFRSILFALNFGKAAERALGYALSLAQEHAGKLTFLHVIEDSAAHTEEGLRHQQEDYIASLPEMPPETSENCCNLEFHDNFR